MTDPYIQVSDKIAFLYIEHARVETTDGTPIMCDSETKTPLPVGRLACLMLGPGTTISHRAVEVFSRSGCTLLWTGEHGVRVYAAGQAKVAHTDRLISQFQVATDLQKRLFAARRLYRIMLGKEPPAGRSVDQLRGLEGVWVKARYQVIAERYGVTWHGRRHDNGNAINHAISQATSTLYAVTEAALLAIGFLPSIGIVHRGDPRSLVFDIADTVKFDTVVPEAFRIVAEDAESDISGRTRHSCRDLFVRNGLLSRLADISNHVVLGHALPSR